MPPTDTNIYPGQHNKKGILTFVHHVYFIPQGGVRTLPVKDEEASEVRVYLHLKGTNSEVDIPYRLYCF